MEGVIELRVAQILGDLVGADGANSNGMRAVRLAG